MSRPTRALRVGVLVLAAGAVGGLVLPVLVAGDAPVQAPRLTASPAALQYPPRATAAQGSAAGALRRAALAGRRLAYSGTQFLTSWSRTGTTTVVVDLQHRPGHGMWVRVQGNPSGATAGKGTADSGVVADSATGTLDDQGLAILQRHYALTLAGKDRTAGRPSSVVEARRRPDGKVAGRFWLDDATGLLLRRQFYDSAGRSVRAAAYIDVRLSASSVFSDAAKVAASAAGRPLGAGDLGRLRTSGWQIPPILAGGLELYDARLRPDGDKGGQVLHLSYSDGLYTVSVFAQRGRLDTAGMAGWARATVAGDPVYSRSGLTRRVAWASAGTVYTIVAEAPDELVDRAVQSFPRTNAGESMLHRARRGLAKMGSWLPG